MFLNIVCMYFVFVLATCGVKQHATLYMLLSHFRGYSYDFLVWYHLTFPKLRNSYHWPRSRHLLSDSFISDTWLVHFSGYAIFVICSLLSQAEGNMAATFLKAVLFFKVMPILSLSYGDKLPKYVLILIELNVICVCMLRHSLRSFDI